MYAAFPRSEYYERVRLPPPLRLSSGLVRSVGLLESARGRTETAVDLPGSQRFRFRACRALRPRRSLRQSSPIATAYCCLPGIRPCRPADVDSRGSIALLALRPARRSAYA